MSTSVCYEDPDCTCPRSDCRCRNCYAARERMLDPTLIGLIRDSYHLSNATVSGPAVRIVHEFVNHYLVGAIERNAMYPGIVRALVELSNHQYAQFMDMVKRSNPAPLLVPSAKVSHVDGDPTNNDPSNLRVVL